MSDEKDPADEPAYVQLGDAGNPYTNSDTDDTESEDASTGQST